MFDFRPLPPLIKFCSNTHFVLLQRCVYGFLTALVVGIFIGRPVIYFLKKQRLRQVFRTRQQVRDLAVLHDPKAGVPTMGGFIVMISSMIAVAFWTCINDLVAIALIVYLCCSVVGALDDLMKIRKGNSKGLSSWLKLFFQAIITGFVVYAALENPPINDILMRVEWQFLITKFTPQVIFYATVGFYFFIIAGTSNAVNLTDGIDGLAISNLILGFVFFAILGFFSNDFEISRNSVLTYIGGAAEIAVLSSCFAGGCLAFLLFNHYPASVFMGDFGSIGLGGLLAIIAMLLRQPFMLAIVGFIFVIESLSVMLQMTSKKLFKRKVFLMAPIHHHFELKGFREYKIARVAFLIQAILSIFALYIVFHAYIEFI